MKTMKVLNEGENIWCWKTECWNIVWWHWMRKSVIIYEVEISFQEWTDEEQCYGTECWWVNVIIRVAMQFKLW